MRLRDANQSVHAGGTGPAALPAPAAVAARTASPVPAASAAPASAEHPTLAPLGELTRNVDNHLWCPLAPTPSNGQPIPAEEARGWQAEFEQLARVTEHSLTTDNEELEPRRPHFREGKVAIIWIEPRHAGGRSEAWFDAAHFLLPDAVRASKRESAASLLLISRCWEEHPPGAFAPLPASWLWHRRSGRVEPVVAAPWIHVDGVAAEFPPTPLARWVTRLRHVATGPGSRRP